MTWSIQNKIIGGFLGVVVIFGLCGAFVTYEVEDVGAKSKKFIEEYMPSTDLIMETQITVDQIAKEILSRPEGFREDDFLFESKQSLDELLNEFSNSNLPEEDRLKVITLIKKVKENIDEPVKLFTVPGSKMEEADGSVEPLLDEVEKTGDIDLINTIWESVMAFNDILITGDPEEQVRFNQLTNTIEKHPLFPTFEEAYWPFKSKGFAVFDSALQLKEVRGEFLSAGKALSDSLKQLERSYNQEIVLPEGERIVKKINMVLWVIGGAIFTSIVLSLLAGLFIARGISKPVNRVVHMIKDLERGCINSRLKMTQGDEIGEMARAMDFFAENLQNEIVDVLQALAHGDLTFSVNPRDRDDVLRKSIQKLGEDLNELMGQIRFTSEKIASSSSEVAASSHSLSQGATEQASSLEEISASMNELSSQTSLNAKNASDASQLSIQAKKAAESGNSQMEELVSAMAEINQSGENISKIIKVIDEIAFQTNLLSLNAAVEAARAGQHGKGFAVVAEEVRNLASRSAKAARETAELIKGSVDKARKGVEFVDQTSAALSEIVDGITKTCDLVGEIAASSNEQAQGIGQVNQALGQIDQVTQQNTANAEQSAAAAEELSAQAEELRQMLAKFRLKCEEDSHAPDAYLLTSEQTCGK